MSQKAWMNAFTKGSKQLQHRLKKVHKNNPEFQHFLKTQGMDNTLSVKQSGLHQKSVATVKPVTEPHPESNKNMSREAMIKAAAEKIRGRRLAAGNRAAFGGELGGGFQMPMGGFRTYREQREINELSDKRLSTYVKKATKSADRLAYYSDSRNDPDWIKSNKREKMIAVAKKKLSEDIAYKDGHIAMYRGGWIAKRNGKRLGTTMPSDEHAKQLLDATRKSIGQKTMDVLRRKKAEIMRGLGHNAMAVENAETRKGGRSWDSAVTKRTLKDRIVKALERKRINKTVDYIKNPKYSVLDKNTITKLLKGE